MLWQTWHTTQRNALCGRSVLMLMPAYDRIREQFSKPSKGRWRA